MGWMMKKTSIALYNAVTLVFSHTLLLLCSIVLILLDLASTPSKSSAEFIWKSALEAFTSRLKTTDIPDEFVTEFIANYGARPAELKSTTTDSERNTEVTRAYNVLVDSFQAMLFQKVMEQQKIMDAAKSSSTSSSSSSSSSSTDNTFSPIPIGAKAIPLTHNILLKKDNLLKWAKSNYDLFTFQRHNWKLGFQSVKNIPT